MKEFIKTLRTSTIALLMLALMFMVIEPTIGNAVDETFTITQVVLSEISFLTTPSDIVMSPSLGGIIGGTSVGSTSVRVYTNDSSGYSMTLTASSSSGMVGNAEGGTIPAYIHSGSTTPEFTFTAPANTARFGYTVEASTTADLSTAFKDNGTICGAGSSDTAYACWINASTSAVTIINRSSETTASGSTSTIGFRVVINSNPVPAIPEDIYVATTTLTATSN